MFEPYQLQGHAETQVLAKCATPFLANYCQYWPHHLTNHSPEGLIMDSTMLTERPKCNLRIFNPSKLPVSS